MANSTLKKAIASGETIIAPGVYDMISATIAERKLAFRLSLWGGLGSLPHIWVFLMLE